MGWTCKTCGKGTESDNLNFPIMHETTNPGHEVEPSISTAARWVRALGA